MYRRNRVGMAILLGVMSGVPLDIYAAAAQGETCEALVAGDAVVKELDQQSGEIDLVRGFDCLMRELKVRPDEYMPFVELEVNKWEGGNYELYGLDAIEEYCVQNRKNVILGLPVTNIISKGLLKVNEAERKQLLFKQRFGASLEVTGGMMLHAAVKAGHVDVVKELLEQFDVSSDATDTIGHSALYYAIYGDGQAGTIDKPVYSAGVVGLVRQLQIIQLLMRAGADYGFVNVSDPADVAIHKVRNVLMEEITQREKLCMHSEAIH